jgi:hypothetical protein
MTGRVTKAKAFQGRAAEILCCLLEASVEAAQPGLDDHGRVGQRQGRVAEGHGPEAARQAGGHEQQQERQAQDHLRHHQGGVDAARQRRAAAEPPAAHQRHGRQHAEGRSQGWR